MAITRILRKPVRDPIAVLLHDGIKWHGASFWFEGNEYRCVDTRIVGGADPKTLPEALLQWASANRCERMRVFLPSEVHELDPHLPSDAAADEVQTALSFELAPSLQLAPGQLRVAAVRADTFRMGGDPDLLLAAGFDARTIDRFDAACRAAQLRFEGVGALEMAALARHAREASDQALLVIRHRSMFAAAPAEKGGDFFVRNIPFGPPQDGEIENDWSERIAQRLGRLRARPVLLLTSHTSPHEIAALVRRALDCETPEVAQLDEAAPLILRHAAWANVGVIDNGCASVARPEPERNWKRIACVASAGLVLLALATCVCIEIMLRATRPALRTAVQEAQAVQQTANTLRQQIHAEQRLCARLGSGARVEPIWLTVLEALPEAVGPHSRLRSVKIDGSDLVLQGLTTQPADLPVLRRALDRAVAPLGWTVKEGGIASTGRDCGWSFTYRVTQGAR